MKRFWDKVQVNGLDECWPWTASLYPKGYGRFTAGRRFGLSTNASRVAYELTRGPVPKGMLVCHKCDNKPCCNPLHLFHGTPQDNMDDKVSKGRQFRPQGESNGRAKLIEEQVRLIRSDTRAHQEISEEYDVARSLISNIQHRKAWEHIS